ncbi:MAG TPA: 4Fe-4S dicluster domain-containing protein [Candidatus Saccharimonadales bacterium]|nr:4Fe-4S dicluster domain-containing protein [Candidatus Saccharimonadales bacterium]
MVIDTKRCIGCHTCAMACKVENNLPDKNWWNRTLTVGGKEMDTPSGTFPNASMSYITLACQHCENPACTKVCPVGATYKREADGVVMQDYDKCIGCRYCMVACPYTGVRVFNWEKPKYQVDFAVGDANVTPHQKHTVEKCMLCTHRLAKGLQPACIEVCTARARHFGDFNDPNSKVSQLLLKRSHFQLLPDKETNPTVYFLT